MTYESLKQTIATKRDLNSPTSPLAVFLAGGLCGLVSWACVSFGSLDPAKVMHSNKSFLQIYPIDSAKSIYQRNCLTVGKDGNPKMPRIQFFNRRMYRGNDSNEYVPRPASDIL
jgi:solute carrier family 25 carnitine/acylcarnitine transporter 20/29